MKTRALPLMFCLGIAVGFAQDTNQATASAVEITAEPSHHLKIDNAYVRAYSVEVAPQQSTLMHHHPYDYVAVSIGAAEVDSTTPDGKVKHLVLEDGQVTYTPAGLVHAAADRASTPFRNATIELLQNQGHPVCVKNCGSDPRAKDWPALPDGAKLIGYGDGFRITEAILKPQQRISTDEPFPHLAILLTDVQARVGPMGEGGRDMNHAAGELIFHGGHPDVGLTNLGKQDIRIVEIEFKPLPAKP